MIKAIINGMLGLLTYLIDILLIPINSVINQFVPNINTYISGINSFLDICSTYIGWVFDSVLINAVTIDLLIAYLTAKITAPLLVSAIKTLVKWWEALV